MMVCEVSCLCFLKLGSEWVNFLYLPLVQFLASVNSYVIPTFHNLTRMKLEVGCRSGWKLLIDFLECSPRLEVLAIENVDKV